MKRTIPLWITAVCGFVLIAAHFSPYTERWGEATMIWFDILASIAFILGGGNLLKMHLKKVFDRAAGWAYSLITVAAFLVTLYVGLAKWGVPPGAQQEHYGESYAPLALAEVPVVASVEGTVPGRAAGGGLPRSVRRQLAEADGRLLFRGWMLPDQKKDLLEVKDELRWKCAVEKLADAARPPEPLRGKVAYYVDHEVLAFQGSMTAEDRKALMSLGHSDAWRGAVESLYAAGQRVSQIEVGYVPPGFDAARARKVSPAVGFDPNARTLSILGPMSLAQRKALREQFPLARPMPPESPARAALWTELTALGLLGTEQAEAFHAELDGVWTAEQLIAAIHTAGLGEEADKTACEMLAEQEGGAADIRPKKPRTEDRRLTDAQLAAVRAWAAGDDLIVDGLLGRLAEASGGTAPSFAVEGAKSFLSRVPTQPEQNKELCLALIRAGSVADAQREFLLADYRNQLAWQTAVGELFRRAHVAKYRWSGEYNAPGAPFWWLYEYAFRPLTATMFAMLAFYVASAAFRAFRAKNLEATLLLATAFVILLGRTAVGTAATGWLPWWLAGLRLDHLTVSILAVFNTAGTRAIMIGIALGIAATSLKVLLGIDRSYLGPGDK